MMIDYIYRKEYFKNYRKENSEKINNIKKKYRGKNKEKIKKYNREYEKTESAKGRIKRYRGTDKFKDTDELWNKSEEGKASRQRRHFNRQTREKEITNTLTLTEWLDILEEYNYKCVYCGVEFDCENLPTHDHIIPISKGGNNVKENIIPACKSSNSKKKDKLDFILARGEV